MNEVTQINRGLQNRHRLKIGLACFYSNYYEPVAPNLRETKQQIAVAIERQLAGVADVLAAPLIESTAAAEAFGQQAMAGGCDLIVAAPLVAVFGNLVQSLSAVCRDRPFLLLNVAESENAFALGETRIRDLIDHSHGLAVEAFANVLMRNSVTFDVVTGALDTNIFWTNAYEAALALTFLRNKRRYRLALFGHVLTEMSDIVLDTHRLQARLPFTLVSVGHDVLRKQFRAVAEKEIHELDKTLRERFVVADMPKLEWQRSLRLSLAYRHLCIDNEIEGGALNSHGVSGLDDVEIGIMSTLAISLLTEFGISLAEVGDLQTGIALFLCKYFGWPATYAELDFVDAANDCWFLANGGEMDLGMLRRDGKPQLCSNVNFRGRCGGGAAFDAAWVTGAATLVSFTEGSNGTYRLIMAEGEILSARSSVLQLVNGTFRPKGISSQEGYTQWCRAGAVHHVALTTGHRASILRKLASILGVKTEVVG